jgi:hypothetical protein
MGMAKTALWYGKEDIPTPLPLQSSNGLPTKSPRTIHFRFYRLVEKFNKTNGQKLSQNLPGNTLISDNEKITHVSLFACQEDNR